MHSFVGLLYERINHTIDRKQSFKTSFLWLCASLQVTRTVLLLYITMNSILGKMNYISSHEFNVSLLYVYKCFHY